MRRARLLVWIAASLLIATMAAFLLMGYWSTFTTPELVETGEGLVTRGNPMTPMFEREGEIDVAEGALLAYTLAVLGLAGAADGFLRLVGAERA